MNSLGQVSHNEIEPVVLNKFSNTRVLILDLLYKYVYNNSLNIFRGSQVMNGSFGQQRKEREEMEKLLGTVKPV